MGGKRSEGSLVISLWKYNKSQVQIENKNGRQTAKLDSYRYKSIGLSIEMGELIGERKIR